MRKNPIRHARLVADHGLEGDAHAGRWARQISLLADEEVERMRSGKGARGLDFDYHTENITTRGADLASLPVGTHLHLGETVLEVTQIGKGETQGYTLASHPREYVNIRRGVFARVLRGGEIHCESECYYDI